MTEITGDRAERIEADLRALHEDGSCDESCPWCSLEGLGEELPSPDPERAGNPPLRISADDDSVTVTTGGETRTYHFGLTGAELSALLETLGVEHEFTFGTGRPFPLGR